MERARPVPVQYRAESQHARQVTAGTLGPGRAADEYVKQEPTANPGANNLPEGLSGRLGWRRRGLRTQRRSVEGASQRLKLGGPSGRPDQLGRALVYSSLNLTVFGGRHLESSQTWYLTLTSSGLLSSALSALPRRKV